MKKLLLTIILIAVVAPTNLVYAQLSKAGTTAAEFLKIPVGARASAISAYTATVNDPSSMVLNPAGLADIGSVEIQVEVTDWYLDINHSYLGAALPTKKGAVGVHVLAMNYGEFEETTAEAQGLTGRTFNAYSVSFGVSYAQYLIPQFTIGGTAKVVYEQIVKSSASTFAFDVGTIYDTPFYGVRFGVSVTNIGAKMQMTGNDLIISSDPDEAGEGNYEPDAKLVTDQFDLPLMLKVGLAWDAIDRDGVRATIAVDGNNPSNNTQSLSVGGEVSLLNNKIFLRGGIPYIGQKDAIETFNGGIGVKYTRNNIGVAFNYTYHGYNYLGDVNKLSIQVFF